MTEFKNNNKSKKVNGRNKGNGYERDIRNWMRKYESPIFNSKRQEKLVAILMDAFHSASRNYSSSAGGDTADIIVEPKDSKLGLNYFPLQLELKNCNTVNYRNAYEQAVEAQMRCKTKENKRVVLITKESYRASHPNFTGTSMVTLSLKDFTDLLLKGELFPKEDQKWQKRKLATKKKKQPIKQLLNRVRTLQSLQR